MHGDSDMLCNMCCLSGTIYIRCGNLHCSIYQAMALLGGIALACTYAKEWDD